MASGNKQAISVLFVLAAILMCTAASDAGAGGIFDVTKLGAATDGMTDSTKAVEDAWRSACEAGGPQTVLIPTGEFLTGPLNLTGPCKGDVTVQIDGTMLGTNDLLRYGGGNWINVAKVDNLVITGSGTLDGQGESVWSIKDPEAPKIYPSTLVLKLVKNATISGITLLNSKFYHLRMQTCQDVTVKNVTITAAADSRNTDGIQMGDSSFITVAGATIGTGDDCVSVGGGSEQITVTGVTCGPGQGISVGCLGRYKDEKDVSDVVVSDCVFRSSTNGVRIKTYADAVKSLTASHLRFQDIKMEDVANPIIIDQHYCPDGIICDARKTSSAVSVKNVIFRNITGTSSTPEVMSLLCSEKQPCSGVELINVNIEYTGKNNKTMGVCLNAKGNATGSLQSLDCLMA